MKSGEIGPQTLGRWETESEWKPVSEVLRSGASSFLTAQQIDTQQAERPAAPIIVPQFTLPRREVEAPPEPKKGNKLVLLSTTGIVVVAMLCVFGYFLHGQEKAAATSENIPIQSNPTTTLDTVASTPAPIPDHERSKGEAKATPSTQTVVAAAPSPTPVIQWQTRSSSQVAPDIAAASPTSEANVAATVKGPHQSPEIKQATEEIKNKSSNLSATASKQEVIAPATTNPFETKELSQEELLQILNDRFSFNTRALEIKKPSLFKYTVSHGSFTLDTHLKYNPKVEVLYAMPMGYNRLPAANADHIILEGRAPGGMEALVEKTVNGKKVVVKRTLENENLCNELGCTVFTLLIHSPQEMWSDPVESYYQGGEQWLDIVFRAQEEIRKRHRLRPEKLILYGHSLGATFVERIAAARPESVAAVVAEDAPEVTLPKKKGDTDWLLIINRGDSMRSEYASLYSSLLKLRQNVVFNIFPPQFNSRRGEDAIDYHAGSGLIDAARTEFIRGVIDPRNLLNKNDVRKWPYVRDRSNPIAIWQASSKQAQNIAEECREYLPSKEFAQCLLPLPPPMQSLGLPAKNKNIRCLIGLPPLGKPVGIAVYIQRPTFRSAPRMIDNIYYYSGKGYLVIAPKIDENCSDALQVVSQWIGRTPLLQAVPTTYVGWGDVNGSLWDSVAKMQVRSPNAIVAVDFFPLSMDESGLPVNGGVKCPVLFVYNQTPLASVSTIGETQKTLDSIKQVKTFVEKCKKRGQFVRTAIAVIDAKRDALEAQQSINMGEDFSTKVLSHRVRDINLP